MNLGDKVCFKCGSKVAEMSHPSARVSTPEDKRIKRASSSSSMKSLCTSQIEASTSPPGQPPGHLNFWKICVQIPPSRGRKAVQMPHHRSIPGDQMPPPPGNFSVAFIMLRKLTTLLHAKDNINGS